MSTDAAVALDPRRWKILGVLVAAAFMDLLDVTIVNVALPDMRRDLHASTSTLEWVAAGYQLAFALVLITAGRLGDVLGRKRLFLIGIAGFTLASLGCGLAPNPGLLIATRFLQGAFAAVLTPQVSSIIQVIFPGPERSKAFGVFGGLSGVAAISGPLLGGFITDGNIAGTGWRPIFLINVPVGILLIVLAQRLVPESRSATAERLDLQGSAVVTVGILLLVYPLIQGRELGWPAWTFVSIALSPVVFVVFWRQQRVKTEAHASPLMVTSLFHRRSFSAGLASILTLMGVISAFFFVLTLTLQVGIGFSPTRAGVTGVPFSVLVSLGAGAGAAVLAPRFGRRVLTTGALLFAGGVIIEILTLRHAGAGTTSWDLLPAMAVAGLGFGLVVAPLFDISLTDVPVDDAGSASGLLGMAQQVGGAVAIAVLGVIFFDPLPGLAASSARHQVSRLTTELSAAGVGPGATGVIATQFTRCARAQADADDPDHVPGCSTGDLGADPAVLKVITSAGRRAQAEAFIDAATPALWTAVGLLGLCALSTRFLPPRLPKEEELDEPAAAGP